MFYSLSGKISHIGQNLAVVNVGGVGFACSTSLLTLAKLKLDEAVTFYTYMHVREDILDLYGFLEQEELNCFKMLIGISGVGPKAALALLSALSPSQLALAVVTGEEKQLLTASGVGKKLAQRIILELKDKIAKERVSVNAATDIVSMPEVSDTAGEASAALSVLGYSQGEIAQVLRQLDLTGLTVEEIVKKALVFFMKR